MPADDAWIRFGAPESVAGLGLRHGWEQRNAVQHVACAPTSQLAGRTANPSAADIAASAVGRRPQKTAKASLVGIRTRRPKTLVNSRTASAATMRAGRQATRPDPHS
jgi:hypothetical protein